MEFVICVNNQDYPASLEIRKIYQVLPDHSSVKHSLIRVVDESGQDYLYPASLFVSIEIPEPIKRVLVEAASN